MKKKIKQAIISVSDKKNLKLILKILKKYKINIISSGGTYKEIKKLGYNCQKVSEFTKSAEILEGRIKTLHSKIFGGILSIRKNKIHQKDMIKNNLKEIDLVIVNFYPFEKTLQTTNKHNQIIENIDIGGPSIVRAAAKNYNDIVVISNTSQYKDFIDELIKNNGKTTDNFRRELANEAFSETGYYDASITNYFNKISNNDFPKKKLLYGKLIEELRYGENPHQKSAIYSSNNKLKINILNGKKLSYNNYNDIYSALKITNSFPKETGTVIIKHANPCGASIDKNKIKSYRQAMNCDPVSAFGGIVSCNFKIKKNLAVELNKNFLEVIIGKGFELSAIKILKKKKNLRIIDSSKLTFHSTDEIISNYNSFLIQSSDNKIFTSKKFKVVSKIKPNSKTFKNLIFAFNLCRFVKSNAVVLAKDNSIVGIGSGQPSRLDSCKIAIEKMNRFQNLKKGDEIISASDAFFPFVDGIETLVQSGVSAIIQPSGSIRDKEIIKYANQTGTILVFANTRHFKH